MRRIPVVRRFGARAPGGAVLLAVLLVAASAVVGCGGAAGELDARVEEFRLIREADGTQVVRGVLVNLSERPIASATVEIALYEGEVAPGVQPAETMRLEIRDVEGGARETFRQAVDTRGTLTGARVQQILIF